MRHTIPGAALTAVIVFALAACTPDAEGGGTSDPVQQALFTADAYVQGYYTQFPEEALVNGFPDAPLDRLGDRSPTALAAWQAREDGWLAELRALDAETLRGTDAWVPYAFDIRTFHDQVLEDGTVTLPMLAEKIEAWVEAGGDSPE